MKCVGNKNVMYVRIYGRLVPISELSFVQVDPNNKDVIVQDIPLSDLVSMLMWHNLNSFVQEKIW